MESAGIDVLWIGEAYGFDATSLLGYLAASTKRVQLGSAIFPIFSRSPALMAMTAAGLDFASAGRFILGLGSSGPQVVRGWHGVDYDRPLARTRDAIEVCRLIWRREKLEYQGATLEVPLAGERPLKLVDHPVRSEIPIYLAALGPKNVALTAELANGWLPLFFHPDKAEVWKNDLAEGIAARSTDLGVLEVVAGGRIALCSETDAKAERDVERRRVALYVGGMGSRSRNFYNDLFSRYGYEAEAKAIQDLYLSGRKKEAEERVPSEFLRATSLLGDEGYVRERVQAYRDAGVTCLNIDIPEFVEEPATLVEKLRSWVDA
jgi:F420-dependent oxidoreductase-like protein